MKSISYRRPPGRRADDILGVKSAMLIPATKNLCIYLYTAEYKITIDSSSFMISHVVL